MLGRAQSSTSSDKRWLFLRVLPEVALALRGGPSVPKSTALQRIAASLGLTLERRNPEVDHPALQLWFRTALPDSADGLEILRRLKQSSAIAKGVLAQRDGYPNVLTGWTIATPFR